MDRRSRDSETGDAETSEFERLRTVRCAITGRIWTRRRARSIVDDQLYLRRTVMKMSIAISCLNLGHVLGPIVTASMHAQSDLERDCLPSSDSL